VAQFYECNQMHMKKSEPQSSYDYKGSEIHPIKETHETKSMATSEEEEEVELLQTEINGCISTSLPQAVEADSI